MPDPFEMPTTPLEVAPSPQSVPAPLASAPVAASPAPATPGASTAPPVQPSMVASNGGDQCPSCGAHVAADQRYCLECGHRRGDPRLPFMDAVVFMDAVKRPRDATPPPPRERRPRISANASLIAGVGTLVLAIGVGVLIGRSGDSGASPAASLPPQVIKVGGGPETASTATTGEAGKNAKGKSGDSGTSKGAKAKSETGSSGTTKAAEEVLKPSGDVKLPPPTVQPGGQCESGATGCKDGKFNGNFFGE